MLDYQFLIMDFLTFGIKKKKKNKEYRTLYCLLEKPMVCSRHLDISGMITPTLSRVLVSSGIMTLWQLVNITGTNLSRAEDLSAHMGLRSLCVVNQFINSWRSTLTSEEHAKLMDYETSETSPVEE